eukprot:TRINITY_DN10105_c0_g1::TRINITY_DN10105_c0_g1_i1::g.21041::m.21041 TRINITY_DN10105_c0_g1::TRINITY_DN10105_c0_g1_i1::g.21041  ORF type:complete len:142 (+),score=9.08,DHODB_Fe-S_bind/PF10418.4/0.00098 TRINITY_DN10105_c0_g1_i1:2-427(+)
MDAVSSIVPAMMVLFLSSVLLGPETAVDEFGLWVLRRKSGSGHLYVDVIVLVRAQVRNKGRSYVHVSVSFVFDAKKVWDMYGRRMIEESLSVCGLGACLMCVVSCEDSRHRVSRNGACKYGTSKHPDGTLEFVFLRVSLYM